MTRNYMTKKTYDRLMEEARIIKEVEIPGVSREKLEASRHGDLTENAEYTSAKEKLNLLHSRLMQLSARLEGAQFIEDLPVTGETVSIGTRVKLLDLDDDEEVEYCILGPEDAETGSGAISFLSPLAKGMITRKAGDEVSISIPAGTRRFKILSIEKYA